MMLGQCGEEAQERPSKDLYDVGREVGCEVAACIVTEDQPSVRKLHRLLGWNPASETCTSTHEHLSETMAPTDIKAAGNRPSATPAVGCLKSLTWSPTRIRMP